MRFTQDRTPTCSRARIASYTVLLAQPAASAIASYDGEALAGRSVVEAPEQRGEHRQRHPAPVLDRDLELVAVGENPVLSTASALETLGVDQAI